MNYRLPNLQDHVVELLPEAGLAHDPEPAGGAIIIVIIIIIIMIMMFVIIIIIIIIIIIVMIAIRMWGLRALDGRAGREVIYLH